MRDEIRIAITTRFSAGDSTCPPYPIAEKVDFRLEGTAVSLQSNAKLDTARYEGSRARLWASAQPAVGRKRTMPRKHTTYAAQKGLVDLAVAAVIARSGLKKQSSPKWHQ